MIRKHVLGIQPRQQECPLMTVCVGVHECKSFGSSVLQRRVEKNLDCVCICDPDAVNPLLKQEAGVMKLFSKSATEDS